MYKVDTKLKKVFSQNTKYAAKPAMIIKKTVWSDTYILLYKLYNSLTNKWVERF